MGGWGVWGSKCVPFSCSDLLCVHGQASMHPKTVSRSHGRNATCMHDTYNMPTHETVNKSQVRGMAEKSPSRLGHSKPQISPKDKNKHTIEPI